jgi:hypothetical protein
MRNGLLETALRDVIEVLGRRKGFKIYDAIVTN